MPYGDFIFLISQARDYVIVRKVLFESAIHLDTSNQIEIFEEEEQLNLPKGLVRIGREDYSVLNTTDEKDAKVFDEKYFLSLELGKRIFSILDLKEFDSENDFYMWSKKSNEVSGFVTKENPSPSVMKDGCGFDGHSCPDKFLQPKTFGEESNHMVKSSSDLDIDPFEDMSGCVNPNLMDPPSMHKGGIK